MIRCLIIKTSSLGDIIHTLPAVTDAFKALKGKIQFDWVVEESFAEIPSWHPAVKQVIPVAIRRWRKHPLKTFFSIEWKQFKQAIAAQEYDFIIEAQGLLKSAWLTRFAHTRSRKPALYGFDKTSAREPLAARFYPFPVQIAKNQHAVERVRQLFAAVLGYKLALQNTPEQIDYGIKQNLSSRFNITKERADKTSDTIQPERPVIMFLHATTWKTKHWPEPYWQALARQLIDQGFRIVLPWGNEQELQRAHRISSVAQQHIQVLDKMNLTRLAQQINSVTGVVAVDTGLAHLAAALDKPVVAIYGPTSPGLTGTYGKHQCHLQASLDCAPCFRKNCDRSHQRYYEKSREQIQPECFFEIAPQNVIQSLHALLNQVQSS